MLLARTMMVHMNAHVMMVGLEMVIHVQISLSARRIIHVMGMQLAAILTVLIHVHVILVTVEMVTHVQILTSAPHQKSHTSTIVVRTRHAIMSQGRLLACVTLVTLETVHPVRISTSAIRPQISVMEMQPVPILLALIHVHAIAVSLVMVSLAQILTSVRRQIVITHTTVTKMLPAPMSQGYTLACAIQGTLEMVLLAVLISTNAVRAQMTVIHLQLAPIIMALITVNV